MDNGVDLNNVFLDKKEDDKTEKDRQLSQFIKDDIYKVCRVNREGYESDKEMYDQNPRKLEKAFNKAELVKLTKERHLKDTMHGLEIWSHS